MMRDEKCVVETVPDQTAQPRAGNAGTRRRPGGPPPGPPTLRMPTGLPMARIQRHRKKIFFSPEQEKDASEIFLGWFSFWIYSNQELRHNAFVQFEETLSDDPLENDRLDGGDVESATDDGIDHSGHHS